MKKEYVEEKIKLFKKTFPDYKISKNGNYYIELNTVTDNYLIENFPTSIGKNQIDKVLEKKYIKKRNSAVGILKPTGGMMIKSIRDTRFKRANLKNLNRFLNKKDFIKIFLIGKNYKWVINYPNYWEYKMITQFNSHKEFIDWLGYDFLTEDAFNKFMQKINNQLFLLIIAKKLYSNTKKFMLFAIKNLNNTWDGKINCDSFIKYCKYKIQAKETNLMSYSMKGIESYIEDFNKKRREKADEIFKEGKASLPF